LNRFEHISNWTEADLMNLPPESDIYEYKSSLIKDDDLGNKISIAASAFWNSGGGIFIAGVDNSGKIDGGISAVVGRHSCTDWVHQIIKKTEPLGNYWPQIITPNLPNPLIKSGNVVLVIGFEESLNVPHMAYDKRYYLRVGSHSDPASHFLVEALRSKRSVQSPQLRAVLRRSDRKSRIVELVITPLNEAVALDVQISFDPFPKGFELHFLDRFPLYIPLIDRLHPFHMELYMWLLRSEIFGDKPVDLIISYKDTLGHEYHYKQTIDVTNSIDPMQIGETDLANIETAINKLSDKLEKQTSFLREFTKPIFYPLKIKHTKNE
jgi:hypothetical protein